MFNATRHEIMMGVRKELTNIAEGSDKAYGTKLSEFYCYNQHSADSMVVVVNTESLVPFIRSLKYNCSFVV